MTVGQVKAARRKLIQKYGKNGGKHATPSKPISSGKKK